MDLVLGCQSTRKTGKESPGIHQENRLSNFSTAYSITRLSCKSRRVQVTLRTEIDPRSAWLITASQTVRKDTLQGPEHVRPMVRTAVHRGLDVNFERA